MDKSFEEFWLASAEKGLEVALPLKENGKYVNLVIEVRDPKDKKIIDSEKVATSNDTVDKAAARLMKRMRNQKVL